MQKMLVLIATGLLAAACTREHPPPAEGELAEAQAEADAAAADASIPLDACALLTRDEVQAAIGPLAGPPESPQEDASDTAEGRCLWRGGDGRVLSLAASGEGGSERIGAIVPYAVVGAMGHWEQARLQGCCLLHAVREEAMVSLDFSAARIELAEAARLVDLALARVHEPLESP